MTGYDNFAAAYARHTASSLHNAHYERPALLRAAGDVRGKSVLDAGCASGENVGELLALGARVTAVDISAEMVNIVRDRYGESVSAFQCDLSQPLPLADASIDLVLSSLTLHYIEDWIPTLREFRRTLSPRGRIVFSTHHIEITRALAPNYFLKTKVSDTWTIAGEAVAVSFWHRPLQAMVDEIHASGLQIDRLIEPQLRGDVPDFDPAAVETLRTRPGFLIFDLTASAG